MEDGDIEESHGWFVITSIKISFWSLLKFILLSITVIQDKFSSLIGFQCFTMQLGHLGNVFLRLYLNRMSTMITPLNIQLSTKLDRKENISLLLYFGVGLFSHSGTDSSAFSE